MFYFFANPLELASQTSPHSVQGNALPYASWTSKGDVRVTSRHTALGSGPINAYAVCDGRVFAGEAGDPDNELLNLVLQPTERPDFDFPEIKYIIYRGIEKSSLLDSSGENILQINSPNGNPTHLVEGINQNYGPTPVAARVIGITETPPNLEATLDSFFYVRDDNYDLPVVQGGWILGTFPKWEKKEHTFGIEIMLDRLGFNPTVGAVKGFSDDGFNEHVIPKGDLGDIEALNRRESLLNYMDPCALFGSFYYSKTGLHDPQDGGPVKGEEVYRQFLHGLRPSDTGKLRAEAQNPLPIFWNRNTTYIDIRNRLMDSYDYFELGKGEIYTDVGSKKANDLKRKDYRHKKYWPIHHLLPSGIEARAVAPTSITGRLAFPLAVDEEFLLNSTAEAFRPESADTSKPGSERVQGRLFRLKKEEGTGRTQPFEFQIPNYDPDPDSGKPKKNPICTYFRMVLIKHETKLSEPVEKFNGLPFAEFPLSSPQLEHLDHVFAPFEMDVDWANGTALRSNVYYEGAYVDHSRVGGIAFMGAVGIARNQDGDTTLFAFDKEKNYRSIRDTSGTKTGPGIRLLDATYDLVGNVEGGHDRYLAHVNSRFEDIRLHTDQINGAGSTSFSYFKPNMVKPEDDLRSIHDFIPIEISAADWKSIRDTYEKEFLNIEGKKNLEGFKTYLAFRYVPPPPQPSRSHNQYEFILRGFAEMNGEIHVKEVTVPGSHHYDTWPSFQFLFEEPSPSQEDGSAFGYKINGLPILTPPTVQHLESTVYFLRAKNLSYREMCDYVQYFKLNVEQVWTSHPDQNPTRGRNPGLLWGIPHREVFTTLHIKAATPRCVRILDNAEVTLSVQRPGVWRRSFISSRRRSGVMFIDDNPGGPIYGHTPAHEFGHLLGLTDRYTFVGGYDADDTVVNLAPGATAMFFSEKADPDYASNYQWYYNLMSWGPRHVSPQAELKDHFNGELSHEDIYRNLGPDAAERGIPPLPFVVTIFITPAQWDAVESFTPETTPDVTLHFLKVDLNTEFTGSFVGIDPNVGGTVLSDQGYRPFRPNAVNSSDPEMILRTKNWKSPGPPESIDHPLLEFDGYLQLKDDLLFIAGSSPNKLEDVFNGGMVTSGLNANKPRNRVIVKNDLYKSAVTSDPGGVGERLWNKTIPGTLVDGAITGLKHPNRRTIIQIIARTTI